MSANTAIYGIVGSNISYSLSPAIFHELFHRHGIDAIYNRFDLSSKQLNDFRKAVLTLPIAGFNVTIPFKESLGPYIDRRDKIVKATGSSNLIINRRGTLQAYNTDYVGIAASIEDKLGFDVHGSDITILGSGGAARTVFYYLFKQRAASITVLHHSRRREKSFSTWATKLSARTRYHSAMLNTVNRSPNECGLCINCTPIEISELLSHELLAQIPRIFELRYGSTKTSRPNHIGGEYMLAVQAVENFRIMTGIRIESEQVVRIIRKASR